MGRGTAIALTFLLLLPMVAPNAGSDGVPIEYTDTSFIWENRQRAFIEVHDDHQTMDLFINTVSLDPGKNMSIVIPLRTLPSDVQIESMLESTYEKEHRTSAIRGAIHRQQHGLDEFWEDAGTAFDVCSLVTAGGGPGLFMGYYMWIMTSHFAGQSIAVYTGSGVRITIYDAFNSSMKLREWLEQKEYVTSERLNETADRYADHFIMVIETTTTVPIDRDVFDKIIASDPESFAVLKDYIMNHPEVSYYNDPYHAIRYNGNEAVNDAIGSLRSKTGDGSVAYLINGIYGVGDQMGFQIHTEMPLDGGKAYFPLGTTMAWDLAKGIEIIFVCDEDEDMDFDRVGEHAVYDGKHYYLFEYDGPVGHDLAGGVEGVDAWERFVMGYNDFMHDKGYLFGPMLTIFFYASMIWTLAYVSLRRAAYRPRYAARKALGILGFTSGLLTVAPLAVAFYFGTRWKVPKFKWRASSLRNSVLLCSLMLFVIPLFGTTSFLIFVEKRGNPEIGADPEIGAVVWAGLSILCSLMCIGFYLMLGLLVTIADSRLRHVPGTRLSDLEPGFLRYDGPVRTPEALKRIPTIGKKCEPEEPWEESGDAHEAQGNDDEQAPREDHPKAE